MNVELLAFFSRVVETGGLAKAGREFGYSAATASVKLSVLESYFGTRLINRTTRSLTLTDEGTILYDRAKGIMAEMQDLKSLLNDGTHNISGPIKLTATHDFGRNTLSPLLDIFQDMNPGVSIQLHMDDSHIDVIGYGVDMAIRMGDMKDTKMMTRKIADNNRIFCAAPKYIERFGMPNQPADLANHNCLAMMFNTGVENEWPFVKNGKNISIRIDGNRGSNNGELIRRWCIDGYGIAYKSIWDVHGDLARGDLVEILTRYKQNTNSSINVVYPGGKHLPRRILALTSFLAAKLTLQFQPMRHLNSRKTVK